MKKVHYGWFVCVGCAMLLFCTSGLSVNAFTVYQPYILELNNYTNTQTSAIITIRSLFAFASMFLTGWYYKRLSLRNGMLIAGLLNAVGFFVFGLAKNYVSYCIGAVCVGFAYGFGTMVPIAIVLEHWFVKKRTLAVSICSAITGLSTLGIPTLLTQMIEKYSLRNTFVAEAMLIAALSVVSFVLIRDDPAKKGLHPYGEKRSAEKTELMQNCTLLKRKHRIVLIPMLLLLGAMTNVGFSHITVLVSSQGFEANACALAVTVSGMSLTCSKMIYGWMAEKIGTFKTNTVYGCILTVGMLLCCLIGTNRTVLYSAMCLYGTGLALTTVGLTAWVGDFCCGIEYDKTVRRFQIGYSAGSLLFSSVPGILADRFAGSYVPAYAFFALCTVVVIASVQWVYKSTGAYERQKSASL